MYHKENLDDEYSIYLLLKLEQYRITENSDIKKAMKFAKFYHKGQFRKSGEPYYVHPITVAAMILQYTKNPIIVAGALLHDVIEDTEATVEIIEIEFGKRIAQIVARLTRTRPDGSQIGVEEIIINAIENNDRDVLLIKIIDRLHNIQTINAMPIKNIHKKINQTINEFVILCEYMELPNLFIDELELIDNNRFINIKKKHFVSDSFQLLPLNFENEINPNRNR
jgi:(p)ppGpp synthase/HD superfamily hydrolase